jgi:hypothetical protein
MTTKGIALAAFMCAALCTAAPYAPEGFGREAAMAQPAVETPIKADIDAIFARLVDELRQAQVLAQQLRTAAGKTPRDTQREVDSAARTISGLADTLNPNGELALRLAALRKAALAHRKRVQDYPKGTIEETDRTTILAAWDKVLQEADAAGTAMSTMHDRLLATLEKLRMRQAAVSELLLAGQYKAAVDTLMKWLNDLQSTVNGLDHAIRDTGTMLNGPAAKTS